MVNFDDFGIKIGERKADVWFEPLYLITDYEDNGIFYSDAKVAYWATQNVTLGSVVKMKYKKKYNDAKYLSTVYFHEGYPQVEKIISIEVPTWLEIEILERNFDGYAIVKNTRKIVLDDVNDDDKKEKDSDFKKEKTKTITYTLKQIPALKSEPLRPGSSHNLPHMIILCKILDEKKAKPFAAKGKFENAEREFRSVNPQKEEVKIKSKTKKQQGNYTVSTINNVNDLYKWYKEIADLTQNDTAITGKKAREITDTCKTKIAKMETLFYWVQDNIRYVAFEDGIAAFRPDACQDALANHYGDCKGMANLLKCMLTSLGLDARLTWIGTKHIAYDYTVPSVAVDNHMICTVFLDSVTYFLDGTEDYIGLNDYAHRIQGRPALIANGKTFVIDTVPDLPLERNLVQRLGSFTISGNNLVGSVDQLLKGEPKTQLLWTVNNTANEEKEFVFSKYLRESYHYILPEKIITSDVKNRNADFTMHYDLTLKNHVIRQGNKIFVNPDYSYDFKNYKTDSLRFFDLSFSHKINYAFAYQITIPAGYHLVALPGNISIDNPEFTLMIKFSGQPGEI